LLTSTDALLAEHRIIEKPPNGLGDLIAAVYLARLLAGQPIAKALQSTVASVFEILARTAKRGGDELQLETDAQSLSHPMAMVQLRHVQHPGEAPPVLTPPGVGRRTIAGADGCKAGWIAVVKPPDDEPEAAIYATFADL